MLRNNGSHVWVSKRKPFIIGLKNKNVRFQFAEEFLNEDNSYWDTVLFSSESKCNIFGNDGRETVWRKQNIELEAGNLQTTVEYNNGMRYL